MSAPPLRIVHIIPQIGIGGTEMQLCHLISRTPADRAKHRVFFYGDSLDEEGYRIYRDSGVVFSRVEGRNANPLAFFVRLAKAIARERPDVVHCWLDGAGLWGRWAALLTGVKHVVVGIRSAQLELGRLLRASRLADGRRVRYLVNTSAAAETLVRVIGTERSRITVIPNGIDLRDESRPAPSDAPFQRLGCPPGARVVLTVGRLTELKNYPMLLRTAARCRGRLPVRFFVAGHGEMEAALRSLAQSMGLADTVHFLGLRRDVPFLLRAADIFCYTSRCEGMPNALLEAMAAARPIVTTKFAGLEDLIDPGLTACVVEQDDDQGACEAIRALLENPAAASSLGDAARRAVEERFSMKRMVEAILGYYDRITRGHA